MRSGRSIAYPLIGLIALVACGMAALNYVQTARSQQASRAAQSEQGVRQVAAVVQSLIRADAPRLAALARSLSAHADLGSAFADLQRSGRREKLIAVLDGLYKTAGVDLLQVSDGN